MSSFNPPAKPPSRRFHATGTALAWIAAGLILLAMLLYGAPLLLDRFARTDEPNIIISLVAGTVIACADAGAFMTLLFGLRRLRRALSNRVQDVE
jgi:hypothetical protein